MTMTGVFVIKYLIVGIMWTVGWVVRFASTNTEVNPKNLGILSAPWIIVLLYFLLFW